MLKIGLTGGIGAGKSIVAKVLSELGFPVFNSDDEAKRILNFDPEIIKQVTFLLGDKAYNEFGLDRAFVASQIFSDDSKRIEINKIVHPKVKENFNEFCVQQNSELVFNEAAIIFETGGPSFYDKTILVTAPADLRIARVLKRDNSTIEDVQKRMDAQWPDSKKVSLADYVIINDNETPVLTQIEKIITDLRSI